MAYGPLRTHFTSRKRITIDAGLCVGCKLCMRCCPLGKVIGYDADARRAYVDDALVCGGCGACLRICPANAVHMEEELVWCPLSLPVSIVPPLEPPLFSPCDRVG